MSAQDRLSKDLHLSSSREQSKAETVIMSEINRLYGLNLEPVSCAVAIKIRIKSGNRGSYFTPWQRCLLCLQLTWLLLFFGSDQDLFCTAHDDKSSDMFLSEERISYQVAPFRDPLFQYNSNS